MTQKHTPGPWTYRFRSGGTTIEPENDDRVLAVVRVTRDVGDMGANARFIVRACNAHEELLAALEAYQCTECAGRGMVNTPCPDPQCGDSTWDHACGLGSRPCVKCRGVSAAVQARAAIAKAQGR